MVKKYHGNGLYVVGKNKTIFVCAKCKYQLNKFAFSDQKWSLLYRLNKQEMRNKQEEFEPEKKVLILMFDSFCVHCIHLIIMKIGLVCLWSFDSVDQLLKYRPRPMHFENEMWMYCNGAWRHPFYTNRCVKYGWTIFFMKLILLVHWFCNCNQKICWVVNGSQHQFGLICTVANYCSKCKFSVFTMFTMFNGCHGIDSWL